MSQNEPPTGLFKTAEGRSELHRFCDETVRDLRELGVPVVKVNVNGFAGDVMYLRFALDEIDRLSALVVDQQKETM